MTEQDPIDPRLAAALSSVEDPELRRPLIDLGMLRAARLEPDGTAVVEVLLTISGCPLRSTIETDVAEAVGGVEGVHRTVVELDVMTPQQREQLKERLGHTRTIPFADPSSLTRVHSVTSGKGGVGKSTVTANLAAALAARGRSVGVVDADIHGFSIPGLFGITAGPTKVDEMILPPVVEVPETAASEDGASRAADGHRRGSVRAISIGMFTDPANPVVWRGPLLDRAVEQFLADVHFGDLDHLLLDLPPGTGDVAIAVAQKLPGSGVLVVSTPQQAQAIVSASRFPPTGTRGFGSPFTQASWGLSTAEYLQHANDGVLVLVQVETRQALENIEEICSVDGLGARFVCFRCGAGIQTG